MKKYSDEELIKIMVKEADRSRRTPSMSDFDSNNNLPSSKTYSSRFGRWSLALKKAGLEQIGINTLSIKEIRERKEKIIKAIKALHKKTGKIPTIREMDNVLPTTSIDRYFGTWNNALESADLIPRSRKGYLYLSDDELIQYIKDFYKKNNRVPKISDFYCKEGYPSPATYKKRFGGWIKARELAGFKVNPFALKSMACEFHGGCFIQNKKLPPFKKVCIYIAGKLLKYARTQTCKE